VSLLPARPPAWLQGDCAELSVCGFQEEARLTPPGGPVFSLALDAREQDGLPNQVWVGNHAKQVGVGLPPATELDPNVSGWVGVVPGWPAWAAAAATSLCAALGQQSGCCRQHCLAAAAARTESCWCRTHRILLPLPSLKQLPACLQVVLDEHCGWVRSLAMSQGRWLFSCACNTLRQWDMSRAVPRCVATVTLERGDILALVARKRRVYAASTDGSIRAWSIGSKGGELTEVACRKKAHGERVAAIALRGGLLYSGEW
jgi:pleiotropic regulator 1